MIPLYDFIQNVLIEKLNNYTKINC